ncbi:MAG: DNA repair protein RecN [Ruminococcaceae bacterium]|nr:DNA repair protein RecN [Oscillospiraceae bacterium]
MLTNLNIENIAVIEKADIEFGAGLNVLTGETGAGKSILVDAINAVLGERTSRELVRHGAENASVTAVFENVNEEVLQKARELGFDAEDGTLIISRRISGQGKSTCRVNGTPSTVSMVKELGAQLVNIHGQHDSQQLLSPEYHYRFLDMTGDDSSFLQQYQRAFRHLVSIRRQLKTLTADADTKDRRLELLDYQIKELTEADIKVGEKEELNSRRNLLMNAQTIVGVLGNINAALSGDDETVGIEGAVTTLQKEVGELFDLDEKSRELYDILDTMLDSAERLKDSAAKRLGELDFSDGELERIEQRLDLLYRLATKYGDREEEMLRYLDEAEKERDSIVNSDEEIERLNAAYDTAYDETVKAADKLSEYRYKLARKLESDVKEQLVFLDMPKIQFVVSFEKSKLSSTGYDSIEFLISTNPGEPPKPLARIASGGELSRIMLAIKNIIAKNDSVDTLIFDEIDTGVSGRASRKIGLKLKSVGAHTQVICVTHSAQIASVADAHMLISKEYKNDKTYTTVKRLDFDARKHELARIMGGLEITDTLLKSAEELLNESTQEDE